MTATATRLVAFAGATPNPRLEPQTLLVQGVVAVRLDPYLVAVEEGNVTPNPDFWDVLTYPIFDKSPYVVLYEAELQEDGSIIVKRDLFGPGDYPVTWSGWPIPGDEALPPSEAPEAAYEELMQPKKAVPATVVLTKDEQKALAFLRKKRNGAAKR